MAETAAAAAALGSAQQAAASAEAAAAIKDKPAIAFQSPKYLQQPGALHHVR